MTARRFLRRWNARVLRREWRQFLVIFGLMLAGVTLSVAGSLAAFNLVEPAQSSFGNGQFEVSTGGDTAVMDATLTKDGHAFGRIDSATLTVTGSNQRVDVRVVDPMNAVTGPLIAVVEGRLPVAKTEVAVTDRAVLDGGEVGAVLVIDGSEVTVVGVVENPTRLSDEFVLASSPEQFGDAEISTRFLVDADPADVQFPGLGSVNRSTAGGPSVQTTATILMNVVSAFGMLEIGLLVSAGFGVIARRRMQQFGLIAAVGATPRQLRSAATGVGLLLGATAAVAGAFAGLLIAWALLPRLEVAVGHRIAFAIPWWAVVVNIVVAVAVAGLAARWPGRSLSREPVVHLLAARRPTEASVGRPAIVGVVVAALGGVALAAGFAKLNVLFAVLGVLLAPIGLLLMAPLLVRVLARAAGSMPLATRLAGRSVGRNNRRSASVVAALALALAIPVAVVVVTSSIDARRVDEGPNLAANWFVAWQPGADDSSTRIPAELDADVLAAATNRIAEAAPELELVPIEVAVLRDSWTERWDFSSIGPREAVEPLLAAHNGSESCLTCDTYGFGATDANGNEITWIVDEAWIATPQMVTALGLDLELLKAAPVALAERDELRIVGTSGVLPGEPFVAPNWPNNARVPELLIAEQVADQDHLERRTVGVLAAASGPIDDSTRDLIRKTVGPDLVLEFHQEPAPRSGLRAATLAIGLVFGVGIAVAAVSLFAVELADDLRVLTSVGAPPRTTRRLSASVALIVAVAGAALALLIGYVALIPLVTAKEVDFPFVVPWRALLALLVVFPALSASAGWLMGTRETATTT